ncbi:hypothetical protein BV25DRAFT_1098446 [Artomyces pyxidatus]|uniref:Uncharacterized protein n=1 Tax=Artomyces pyxidatus TaxID=48021 RepID=A0ACB8TG49_9AGAM|nr:hypothetical protein BV25DRAFT_1098446 [Artomyces pyxidatus]
MLTTRETPRNVGQGDGRVSVLGGACVGPPGRLLPRICSSEQPVGLPVLRLASPSIAWLADVGFRASRCFCMISLERRNGHPELQRMRADRSPEVPRSSMCNTQDCLSTHTTTSPGDLQACLVLGDLFTWTGRGLRDSSRKSLAVLRDVRTGLQGGESGGVALHAVVLGAGREPWRTSDRPRGREAHGDELIGVRAPGECCGDPAG